ncbi:uncharacterized protein MONOS_11855 [Monocercomonoides exilis]|uniref:uncharacterized protein n=1 Tax=Monocercomonoides exilis TaxID=2049356 RepID=UPI0035596506|nr:hypothetical protein MONOS_11855 [Monocercomonoides exilis]|eukprot:MONOS_11855.1-p1 / transcript=MONOS_11855.1 / gene=MONOS_11855 / organism=Monocercomonoides_exilis_PA203 / gene_product=unspecified product / transcript_product=unspecified product / location=Mono_scaffold00618:33435-34550(-) / protein_length=372 / sequence_SO=supercontig / SO=protein_coding / is_pseudo=false
MIFNILLSIYLALCEISNDTIEAKNLSAKGLHTHLERKPQAALEKGYYFYSVNDSNFVSYKNTTIEMISNYCLSYDNPRPLSQNFTLIPEARLSNLKQYKISYEDASKNCDWDDVSEGVRSFYDALGLNMYLDDRSNHSISISHSLSCVGLYNNDEGTRHRPSDKCDHITPSALPLAIKNGFVEDTCYSSTLSVTEECPAKCTNSDQFELFFKNKYAMLKVVNQPADVIKDLMLAYGHCIITMEIPFKDWFDFAEKFDEDSSVLVSAETTEDKVPYVLTLMGWGVRSPREEKPGDEFWLVKSEKMLSTRLGDDIGHVFRVGAVDRMSTGSNITAWFFPLIAEQKSAGIICVAWKKMWVGLIVLLVGLISIS